MPFQANRTLRGLQPALPFVQECCIELRFRTGPAFLKSTEIASNSKANLVGMLLDLHGPTKDP
jgi:hypothetical protein